MTSANLMLYILSLCMIIILIYTYYYLVEISNCPCFLDNKRDTVNLEYMKFYVLLDLFSIIIALSLLHGINQSGGGKRKKVSFIENILIMFSIIIVVLVHSYMTYNVYQFYNSIKSSCACVNKWQKYFIYYEGIVSGLVSIQYILFFLFILIFLLFHSK